MAQSIAQLGEYTIAWLVYLAAVLGLLIVCWRLFRGIGWRYVRRVLWLTCAVLLLTPAIGAKDYWAPAWIMGSLEALFGGLDIAIPIATMMGTVLGVVLGLYTVFSIIARIRGGSPSGQQPTPKSHSTRNRKRTPPRVA